GVVSARERSLRYVNAGHLLPVWWTPRGGDARAESAANGGASTASVERRAPNECDAGGTPVGLLPEATYEAGACDFAAGARLVVFSDGVTDAENTAGATYECGGVSASLADAARSSPADADPSSLGARLVADLDRFRAGAPAKDDTTLLVVGFG
ncbi:MAG: PP2C family protein-serine/threonine phosphatase, partial [Pyrinomonadaceae bacterium]